MKYKKSVPIYDSILGVTPPPPPPPPKSVMKIRLMLRQVEELINLGHHDLAGKHWDLIAEECSVFGDKVNEKEIKHVQGDYFPPKESNLNYLKNNFNK